MKIVLIVLAVLLVAVVVLLAGAWSMFGEKVKAAQSVRKLEDGLYYVEYSGDYGFDAFLNKGGASSEGRGGRQLFCGCRFFFRSHTALCSRLSSAFWLWCQGRCGAASYLAAEGPSGGPGPGQRPAVGNSHQGRRLWYYLCVLRYVWQ